MVVVVVVELLVVVLVLDGPENATNKFSSERSVFGFKTKLSCGSFLFFLCLAKAVTLFKLAGYCMVDTPLSSAVK